MIMSGLKLYSMRLGDMKYIVLTPNANGKFEFTKEELQKLLDEAYEQGKKDASTNFVPIYYDTKDYKWEYGGKIDVTCGGNA